MPTKHLINIATLIASVALLVLCVPNAPVLADGVTLTGGLFNACSDTITSGAASITCAPTGSSALTVTPTAMANLSTGTFGVEGFVSDVGGTGLGSGSEAFAEDQVTYVFAVSGISNGTAQFDISVSGLLTSTECGSLGCNVPGTGPSVAEFTYFPATATVNGIPGPVGGVPLGNGTTAFVISTPITSGTTELQFGINVGASCAGSDPCTSTANFLDPTQITGASAYASNGNLISGATFLSESGFNPNAASVLPTPEPSSLLLMGTGLLALIGAAKFRVFTV